MRSSYVSRRRAGSSLAPLGGYIEEFAAQRGIVIIRAAPAGGVCHGGGFAHASHLGAEMLRLEIDGDAMRLQDGLQGAGYLHAHALLDGEALGEEAHEAG